MNIRNPIAGVLCAVLVGCSPREAYQSPVADFGKATASLSDIASEQLASERSEGRTSLIREYLTTNLKQQWEAVKTGGEATHPLPKADTFICKERSDATPNFDARDYLSAVAKAMEKTVAPPPTETDDLIAALASSYDIDVSATDTQTSVNRACEDDFKSYLETVYLEGGRQENALLALEGLQALAGILKEAASAALTEIDSARRAAAMKRFLNNPKHKEELNDAITRLEKTLTDAATRRQHLAMKAAVDRFEEFDDALRKLDLTSAQACAPYLALPQDRFTPDKPRHAESAEFRQCYRYAWDQLSNPMVELVAAAASYDAEADKTVVPAFSDLKKATTKLEKLADDEIDADEAKAMLVAALRMAKVAGELKKTVTSEETRTKVKDALEKIRSAL